MVHSAMYAVRHLVTIDAEAALPDILARIYPALQTLTETHQTSAAISALTAISRTLLDKKQFPSGAEHIFNILELTLPGIDPNDSVKTQVTFQLYMGIFSSMTMIDCSLGPFPDNATEQEVSNRWIRLTRHCIMSPIPLLQPPPPPLPPPPLPPPPLPLISCKCIPTRRCLRTG